MINTAFISIGSNIGDRCANMELAIKKLKKNYAVHLVNASSIYETDPVGYEDQDQFLNMVIQVETMLNPFELLNGCLEIETAIGRKREIRWGPRTIDLDILLYNQENMKAENLIIPHPRMQERAFVIIPLLEISPNIIVPTMNQPLRSCLTDLSNKEGVRLWKRKNGEDVFALFAN